MTAEPVPNKEELMFLGQECHHPACHLHDFLPFSVSIICHAIPTTDQAVSSMSSLILPTPLPPLAPLVYLPVTQILARSHSAPMSTLQSSGQLDTFWRSERSC